MKNNDHLILICGKAATGKSTSLKNIKNPEGVIYLNCENGKELPFKSKFKNELTITDPNMVYQAFTEIEKMPDIHTIIIDSLSYLMDLYESTRVLTSSNTQKAWGDYAQYLKILMSQFVAKSTKNVIFLAHTTDVYNEAEVATETFVKVKGSLMNVGIESFFTNVIACKRIPLSKLNQENPLLVVTPDEERDQFKYVFQTRLTKETVNERIRSPIGMWKFEETYIDNNIQHVIDRLHQYYT